MAPITRRNFLATAGLTALGATLPRRARAGTPTAKNLIVVFASGGWDPTHVLDPKTDGTQVDLPPGSVQMYGNLPIFVDAGRPNVTAFFDSYAPVSAVVNGIQINSIAHPECRERILTGTRSETSPDLAVIAAFELGWELPAPYLVLGTTAYSGDLASGIARVGARNQIVALLDPTAAAGGPYPVPNYLPSTDDAAAIRAYVESRAERVRAGRASLGKNLSRLNDYLDSLGRGDLLVANRAGFGTTTSTLSLASQRALAVQMIEEQIAFSVMVDSGEGWDTHSTNSDQEQAHDDLYRELKLLADDLAGRPGKQAGNSMLDETVVLVASEMGRTPKLNSTVGKDHWPVGSLLVFGGGVAGGKAYGGTTDGLEARTVDFATGDPDDGNGQALDYSNVVAGLIRLVGADPANFLPDVEVFDAFVA